MKPNRTTAWGLALTFAILLDHWKLFYPSQYSLLTGAEGVRQAYSWFNMWVRTVGHGAVPAWDPYALGGFSFPGEMQTAAFYPLYLVLLLFRPNRFGLLSALEYNSVFLAAYVMAAVFMFAFVRDLGLSRFAAFVAGFSFSSAGFVAHSPWPHMLQSAVWLPLIALFWLRALRSMKLVHSLRNAAFAGLFLGLSLLAGGLHIAMAQGIFLVSAGVFHVIVRRGSPMSERDPGRWQRQARARSHWRWL